VTAQPLAPVIPSSSVPAARRRAGSAAGRPLPLASPVRSVPQDVVYGIARIDSSGRICERAIITALRRAGGDRLTFTADAGVVTTRHDPGVDSENSVTNRSGSNKALPARYGGSAADPVPGPVAAWAGRRVRGARRAAPCDASPGPGPSCPRAP
jgi:hypothetical protein